MAINMVNSANPSIVDKLIECLKYMCTYGLVNIFTGRYWEMVQRLKVTQLYTSPTAIRLLLKAGDTWVHKYDRSSLKTLGCGQLLVPWQLMLAS